MFALDKLIVVGAFAISVYLGFSGWSLVWVLAPVLAATLGYLILSTPQLVANGLRDGARQVLSGARTRFFMHLVALGYGYGIGTLVSSM